MPLPGSASCGTASNSNDIEGLNELIDLLNDHGEALLGFEEPGPEHTANRTEEPADTPAHVCTLPSASEAIATANYRVSAPATQRAATTAAAKHRKNVKLSSSRKQKLELEYLLAEHQSIQQQLQSLQLDNKRLRLKQALLHAINQAKQQLLDVLWQHREATSSDGNSSKSNDNTIAALQDLEQQVQQLLQASGAIELPTEPGSSSTSNGTDGSTHSSWHSGSPSSSGAFLARAASYTAAAAAQQQQSLPPRLPLQHTISLPNNPQQPNLQQQQQQKSPQQQQLGDAAGAAAEGWCPDPLQDPLWLLKRGMAHLNLSAAVVASREERLVAWQHVQGQLSLLLRAIDNDEGTGGSVMRMQLNRMGWDRVCVFMSCVLLSASYVVFVLGRVNKAVCRASPSQLLLHVECLVHRAAAYSGCACSVLQLRTCCCSLTGVVCVLQGKGCLLLLWVAAAQQQRGSS
jgi:hypothetical protein